MTALARRVQGLTPGRNHTHCPAARGHGVSPSAARRAAARRRARISSAPRRPVGEEPRLQPETAAQAGPQQPTEQPGRAPRDTPGEAGDGG